MMEHRLPSPPISLLLLDVDGVLTDNSLYFGPDGEQLKSFNARDGVAVALLRTHGIRSGVMSGRDSPALMARVRQLTMDFTLTGVRDKLAALETLIDSEALHRGSIAYVGDDVIDLPLADQVGLFMCPADAHPMVKSAADHVLSTSGGKGAAREAAEYVLETSGYSLESAYAELLESHRKTIRQ